MVAPSDKKCDILRFIKIEVQVYPFFRFTSTLLPPFDFDALLDERVLKRSDVHARHEGSMKGMS